MIVISSFQDDDDCLGIGTPLCATAERLRASAFIILNQENLVL